MIEYFSDFGEHQDEDDLDKPVYLGEVDVCLAAGFNDDDDDHHHHHHTINLISGHVGLIEIQHFNAMFNLMQDLEDVILTRH